MVEIHAREIAGELSRVDRALYSAVAGTPTPNLDGALRGLSRSADKSVLWFAVATGLAAVGGPKGRRAAMVGAASIGTASAVVNLGAKTLARRRRPERVGESEYRFVPMPTSTSFPSGHSASAFAFAQSVSSVLPAVSVPLHLAATSVAYSRVHTGVHYPGDVVAGTLIGITVGSLLPRVLQRMSTGRSAALRARS